MKPFMTFAAVPAIGLASVLAALAGCTHAMPVTQAPTSTHTLTLRVEGVRSSEGQLRAELLGRAQGEPTHRRITFAVQEAEQGANLIRFPNLPAGDYAVQLYHDENGNGQVDMNVVGVPREGYGFSNVPVVQGGIPPFERMKVTVDADTSATAVLVYQP